MSEERSVIERLDSLEEICLSSFEKINQLAGVLEAEKATKTANDHINEQHIFRDFLKTSRKYWRWFGNRKEFLWQKTLTITVFALLLVFGIVAVALSPIELLASSFGEILWMGFVAVLLIFACKTQLKYDVNTLATYSSTKYETDYLGMKFPRKGKLVYAIFRVIGIVMSVYKIIFLGIRPTDTTPLAITMEILFIVLTIVSYFTNLFMFGRYSIIWVEGHAITTKEKVTLLLPPGAKSMITEEEFKKLMPELFE